MPATRRALPLYLLALLLTTALAYWPGLSGGFMFDDFSNIVQVDRVHAQGVDLESLTRAASSYGGPIGRPLATMSFAIDHAFSGLDPRGYKLTSLLLHLLNAAILFGLLRRLLPHSTAPERWGDAAAFAIALLWAIHPLQVSSVLYVVQRMETMATLFVLLALWSYLVGRERQIAGARGWPWLAACVPLVALGLGCKETAAIFPAYALALELTVLGFRAAEPTTVRALRLGYVVGTLLALTFFALVIVPTYATAEAYAIRDYGVGERLLTQLRALSQYIGWIVLPRPADFVFYYDNYTVSRGLLEPATTLVSAIFLAALAAAAWAARRKMPMFTLGILWFFAAHVMTSNIVPLELVFEHRNYFALLGILLAIAELVRRLPSGEIPRIREIAVGAVLVGFLALTMIRSATWGDPLTLAGSISARNPGSSRASMDLGEQYLLLAHNDPTSRWFARGVAELERGSRMPESSPLPEQALIAYSAAAGVEAKPEWWDRVDEKLRTRAIGPQEGRLVVDLLDMRNEGLPIDDRRLADAYVVLVERVDMPALQYYAFAEHAFERLQDRELAGRLLDAMVAHADGDAEFVAAVAQHLLGEGHRDLAERVAAQAEAAGVARIELPAAD